METSIVNLIVVMCLIILSMTFVDSIIVMIGGKNIFKKAHKNEKSALYPIANLFTLLEISNMSTFFGILFFIPIINYIVLSIMFYKLGSVFNTSVINRIGLVLFPIIFYPLLAFSDKQYNVNDKDYLSMLESAKDESINLLSDEELNALNNSNDEETEEVDSIFKSEVQMMEEVAPYKAKKNNYVEVHDENNNKKEIEFIELEGDSKKDKDNIEMIDL